MAGAHDLMTADDRFSDLETLMMPARSRARLIFRLVVGLLLMSVAAGAQAKPAPLTGQQQAMLDRTADYLNGVKTLKARFTQRSSRGAVITGDVWIWRPGRFRFEYDPPNPFLLVADAKMVGYYDFARQESSFIPLAASPAAFFLRQRVTFDDPDITVTGFNEDKATVRVSLVQSGEAEEGSLTLSFSKDPLVLSGWTIVGGDGVATTVAIDTLDVGVKVTKDMFLAKEIQWMAPRMGMKPQGSKRIRSQSLGINPNDRDR